MYCKNCGMNNNEDSKFCMGCGAPLQTGEVQAGSGQPDAQQSSTGQQPVMHQPAFYTRSELGISTALLGAAMYFMGLFSGYMVLVLLSGYVLIREKDSWLRYVAVKSVVISVLFSILSAFVGLVPDFLDFFASLSSLFQSVFTYEAASKIIYVLNCGIDIVRTIVFLMLGFKALGQKDVRFGVADKQTTRHIMENRK